MKHTVIVFPGDLWKILIPLIFVEEYDIGELLTRKGRLMDRNVNIITDLDSKMIVLINDIRFKAKKREDWKDVEEYMQIRKAEWL